MSAKWYPTSQFSEQDIIRKIMRDTWMAGYNVKSIAGYFKLSLCSVYNYINIRGLKRRKLIAEYRKTLVN